MSKWKGKKVLIVGLGKTGQAAIRYFATQGAKIFATDTKSKAELTEPLRVLGNIKVEYDLGRHTPKFFTSADCIVLSPGVSSNIEPLHEARAKGVPITNDIELAFPYMKAPIIAVTGTNGKTTTATLISEILKNDGKKVFLGGNIGVSALEYVLSGVTADVIVLELSSFQLELLHKFKPKVSVFTNLEPDHLDRYPEGVEKYYEAKKRLLHNADKSMTLVTNLDNPLAAQLGVKFPGTVYSYTKKSPMSVNPAQAEKFRGAYLSKPNMVLKMNKEEAFDLIQCKLPGDHNKENLMAASIAAWNVGCSRAGIQKTIEGFKGVTHRLEFVRKKDGVTFYNDSKATNVSSVIRSINSFNGPIILIAGGRDKDQDFAPLVEHVRKRVKNLILAGEAKEKINRVIGDYSETFLVGTLEEGILIAYQKSRSGDVILLSPGCASYDMFKSYEERGDYFKRLVAQL